MMRNLKIIVIALFLVSSVAFSAYFCYDRLMVDHTAPQIFCDGQPLYVSVNASNEELCAGLSAYDNVDGDISDRIVVRKISQLVGDNMAKVSYAVFDTSSNLCTYTRAVYYTDYHKPRFSIVQPLVFNVGTTVTLSDRVMATDTIDGDISGRIRADASSLNKDVAGEYTLPVRVSNSSGDTATLNLTVLMQNATSRHPVIRLSEYLIYVEKGATLTDAELRSYIIQAQESRNGRDLNPEDVEITQMPDTSKSSTYNVYYSYQNAENLVYTVILTVVVE